MSMTKIAAFSLSLAIALSSATAFAEGDAKKGAKVYKKCKACHTIENGGKNKVGPNLFGVVGRKSAQVEGFKYSKAMKAADLTWDDSNLDQYLTKPRAFVKGTKMSFAGIKKESQRQDLIAYLKTFQ
ncbi:cytochrome c family protein [Sneathiella marina]|uniref:Cytochrome c family protein n=1 Tax=Sneathiella marina TaxID=2950108 RepID=A0ABY4W4G9_9PROT|nr:cytochrome c family protein [Sneathiella marina]USG60625.1 cytochrome c family protein [Sneathiella marina]